MQAGGLTMRRKLPLYAGSAGVTMVERNVPPDRESSGGDDRESRAAHYAGSTDQTGTLQHTGDSFAKLEELVATLRHECPWDMAQTHISLGRHLIEEAYETLEALEELSRYEPNPPVKVVDHLKEELGDLMIQVFFHAILEEEMGRFTIQDVVDTLHDKLVARHPHVFGDAIATSPEAVAIRWEKIKTDEEGRDIFSGIPKDLPALSLVAKVQRKADSIGVQSAGYQALLHDLEGSLDGLRSAVAENTATETDLVGDMLLSLARLADLLNVDAESALRESAYRFRETISKDAGQKLR